MTKEKPEQPRKQPRQRRSKILFASILQAGADILAEPDTELTIELLCERVGISAGSLYQYFPSKEAVLSEIFKKVIEDEWQLLQQRFDEAMQMDFETGIQHHAKAGLRFVRRIYDLEPNFYRKYGGNYIPYASHESSQENIDNIEQWSKQAEEQVVHLFKKHPKAANLSAQEIDQLAFVYGRGSVSVLRAIVEERPEYIHDDVFMERLTRVFSLDAMFD